MLRNINFGTKSIPTIERAIRYINKTPPAISGANGHGQTFNLAQHLVHDFALSGEVVLSLLEQHYNPKCEPRWPDKDLRRKVNEAHSKKPFHRPTSMRGIPNPNHLTFGMVRCMPNAPLLMALSLLSRVPI